MRERQMKNAAPFLQSGKMMPRLKAGFLSLDFFFFISSLFFFLLASCTYDGNKKTNTLFVSVLPHKILAERIAGGRFEVTTIIEPGQDPHQYMPAPSMVARLARAKVYFRTGMEFEDGLVPKVEGMANGPRLVDLRGEHFEGLGHARHPEPVEGRRDHDEGGHSKDPHIWLSPVLFKQQAKIIRDVLIDLDSAGRDVYQGNCDLMMASLDRLDEYLHQMLDGLKGREFLVYHPAFGYFAEEYGLEQVAVEREGKEPGARYLAQIEEKVKESGIKTMFMSPGHDTKNARIMAQRMGCTAAVLDPMPGDYIRGMTVIGEMVKGGLSSRRHPEPVDGQAE